MGINVSMCKSVFQHFPFCITRSLYHKPCNKSALASCLTAEVLFVSAALWGQRWHLHRHWSVCGICDTFSPLVAELSKNSFMIEAHIGLYPWCRHCPNRIACWWAWKIRRRREMNKPVAVHFAHEWTICPYDDSRLMFLLVHCSYILLSMFT